MRELRVQLQLEQRANLLNCEFNLQTVRVRLGPNPTSIHQTHFVQTPNSLQTQAQKFFRFECCRHPVVGGVEESAASPAPRHHTVLRNVFRDVDEQRDAGRAQVLGVLYDWHTALATQSGGSGAAVVGEGHEDARVDNKRCRCEADIEAGFLRLCEHRRCLTNNSAILVKLVAA